MKTFKVTEEFATWQTSTYYVEAANEREALRKVKAGDIAPAGTESGDNVDGIGVTYEAEECEA